MDTNNLINMKVADLKKELKARGLSIVGNKSELVARLESALVSDKANSNSTLIPDKDDNEDDDDVLGSDILDGGSEGDPKGDEALIDDLLGNGTNDQNNSSSATNKSAPTILKRTNAITIAPKSDIIVDKSTENTSEILNEKSVAANVLNTANAKALSASERLTLRAKKFGDNALSVRAERFGLSQSDTTINVAKNASKTAVTAIPNSNDDEKLKKRAERFGAVVSTAMKKIDQKEKLLKRKERFGALVVNTAIAPTATKLKRVTNLTKDEEMKKQRLDRFGGI